MQMICGWSTSGDATATYCTLSKSHLSENQSLRLSSANAFRSWALLWGHGMDITHIHSTLLGTHILATLLNRWWPTFLDCHLVCERFHCRWLNTFLRILHHSVRLAKTWMNEIKQNPNPNRANVQYFNEGNNAKICEGNQEQTEAGLTPYLLCTN